MAFPRDILVAGIAVTNTLTKGVQVDCTLAAWTGQDAYGSATYAAPVTFQAVLDRTNKQLVTLGKVIDVAATLTIVGDLAPNGATDRREPIDPRDVITLPDGFTGPIIDVPNAVTDPITGRGLIQQIMLGKL
jgi:hypothetical protein